MLIDITLRTLGSFVPSNLKTLFYLLQFFALLSRNQAATLFLWLLAPFQSDKTRMFAINTISNEAQVKDILFSLLLTNTQVKKMSHAALIVGKS